MEFMGYARSDGRVGIRNHVMVLPTCASAHLRLLGGRGEENRFVG